MAVHIAGGTVGGPPGVANAAAARGQHFALQLLFQHSQAALCLHHLDVRANGQCHARRVIAAVFQLGKALDQNFRRVSATDISNDSTHNSFSPHPERHKKRQHNSWACPFPLYGKAAGRPSGCCILPAPGPSYARSIHFSCARHQPAGTPFLFRFSVSRTLAFQSSAERHSRFPGCRRLRFAKQIGVCTRQTFIEGSP